MTALTILQVPSFSTLCNLAFQLRREVFVLEQNVPPAEENDFDDLHATHIVALADGEVVGTLRLLEKPEHIKIGRVAVRHSHRGQGVARAMMLHAMAMCHAKGQDRFFLTAQTDKVGLYERLGFTAFGPEFQDGGMPHRAMRSYDLDQLPD